MKETKVKLISILKMLIVTILVALFVIIIWILFKSGCKDGSCWILADLIHLPMFVIPFLIIFIITKGKLKEYGFNFNEEGFFLLTNAWQ